MSQWVENVNYRLSAGPSRHEVILLACESHIVFERNHPFADGNGRVGRLLLSKILLQNGLARLVIEKTDKDQNIRFLAEQDAAGFAKFAEVNIERERVRIEQFR